MKHGVSRKTLVVIAGIVWIIAGANILKIGIQTWWKDDLCWLYKLFGAIFVFVVFFYFIFRRLFGKYVKRITRKGDSNCPFAFFDVKGWLIMFLMIVMGILVRHFQLMPSWFIALFYTGLSSALILTGFSFLIYSGKKAIEK